MTGTPYIYLVKGQCTDFINITSTKHSFEMIRTISKPSTCKTTKQKILAKAGFNGDPTIYKFIIFVAKHKKGLFVVMLFKL